MKILDCTLRDGGYYTHWDFDHPMVARYLTIMSQLPIDYIELGYRSVSQPTYQGEFYYLPVTTLQRCREYCPNKKLSVMVNVKEIGVDMIEKLLHTCVGYVDMIRLAIRPDEISKANDLVLIIHNMGFEVGCNIMYMSTWEDVPGIYESLAELGKVADCIWMVDSYGGMLPVTIHDVVKKIRKSTDCALGFHGHNNMELSFANSLAALEEGVEYIDSTILGMGRGAGNLKTELLLTYVSLYQKNIPFHLLNEVIEVFTPMLQMYRFGTNLPYMISGTYSLPQKDIMEWMSKRRYSVSTIVQTLQARTHNCENQTFPLVVLPLQKIPLIIGGGNSIVQHLEAIKNYVKAYADNLVLIFASSKYLSVFDFVPSSVMRYICLMGSEGLRLERQMESVRPLDRCIVNTQVENQNTYVPKAVQEITYSLPHLIMSENLKQYADSPLFISLSLSHGHPTTYLIGFDGYDESVKDGSYDLMHENQVILDACEGDIVSLLPSKYDNLLQQSIYALI